MPDVTSEQFPPCGWACVCSEGDRIEYRPEQWRFELTAERTAEEAWEIRCRQSVGEADSAASLGFVSTRENAVRTLFECMRLINRTMRESGPERVFDVRRLRDDLDRQPDVRLGLPASGFDDRRPDPPTRGPDDRRHDRAPNR